MDVTRTTWCQSHKWRCALVWTTLLVLYSMMLMVGYHLRFSVIINPVLTFSVHSALCAAHANTSTLCVCVCVWDTHMNLFSTWTLFCHWYSYSFTYIFFCIGFLEKNRDTFSGDLLQVIQTSKFKFLTHLFKQDFLMVGIFKDYPDEYR